MKKIRNLERFKRRRLERKKKSKNESSI